MGALIDLVAELRQEETWAARSSLVLVICFLKVHSVIRHIKHRKDEGLALHYKDTRIGLRDGLLCQLRTRESDPEKPHKSQVGMQSPCNPALGRQEWDQQIKLASYTRLLQEVERTF